MVSSGICALSPVIHCLSSSCLDICSVWTLSSCSGGRTWAHFLPCCLVCAPSPTWTLTWEAQHLGLRAETEWMTVTSVTRDGAHCSLLLVYMKDQLTRWGRRSWGERQRIRGWPWSRREQDTKSKGLQKYYMVTKVSKISVDGDCSHELKDTFWKGSYDNHRQHIKKQRHHFADKGLYSQGYGLSSSRVQIWVLDHKEGWTLKNWCFRTVVLEKTLESPLESKEIKPVNPKGNQSSIFIGRTNAKAEAPILWPPDVKNWLIWKDPDSGKDWRHEEKGMTEDEMVGWHHQLDGHEFEQAPGVGDGQGSLACCSSWGHKELDMTEWLNWTSVDYKDLQDLH